MFFFWRLLTNLNINWKRIKCFSTEFAIGELFLPVRPVSTSYSNCEEYSVRDNKSAELKKYVCVRIREAAVAPILCKSRKYQACNTRRNVHSCKGFYLKSIRLAFRLYFFVLQVNCRPQSRNRRKLCNKSR